MNFKTSTTDALHQICDCHSHWVYSEPEYLLISDIGSEIISFIQENENLDLIKKVFGIIEEFLQEDNIELSSLIIAGMFNRMQNEVYRKFENPDCINVFFGKRSLQAWEDYIEGHLGYGFRSITSWRKILIQAGGGTHKIRFQFFKSPRDFTLEYETVTKIGLLPLLAEKTISWNNTAGKPFMGLKSPYAKITIESWYYPDMTYNEVMMIGNRAKEISGGRYIKTKNQIAILDMEKFEILLKKF
jgi:hypothetical protein